MWLSHLTEDITNVRVPMGMLKMLVGDEVPFRWEFTHRDLGEIKGIVEESQSLLCSTKGAETNPIFMVTDSCANGISLTGIVSQETD